MKKINELAPLAAIGLGARLAAPHIAKAVSRLGNPTSQAGAGTATMAYDQGKKLVKRFKDTWKKRKVSGVRANEKFEHRPHKHLFTGQPKPPDAEKHHRFANLPIASTPRKLTPDERNKKLAKIGYKAYKEDAPPGRKDQVKALKKKFGDKAAFAIAWSQHNKHGKPTNEDVPATSTANVASHNNFQLGIPATDKRYKNGKTVLLKRFRTQAQL